MKSKVVVFFALTLISGLAPASPSRMPASDAIAAHDFADPNNAQSQMGESYAQEKSAKNCSRRRGGNTSSEISSGGAASTVAHASTQSGNANH